MNKQAKEILDKAIIIKREDKLPLFEGIYIIPERKLHDSGYRLMNIIAHTEYDYQTEDFRYYLISICSDVIDLENLISDTSISLDISKSGVIHIWTRGNKKLKLKWGINLSSCVFEIV